MGPVGGRNSGHEIRDPRSVLRDAHTMAARGARVTVGHMNRALLVGDRHELNASRREDIQRVHERRADDAEDVRDAIRGEGLDERLRGSHLLRLGHGCTSCFRVSSGEMVCLFEEPYIIITPRMTSIISLYRF